MNGYDMSLLMHRFDNAGYRTHRFHYPSRSSVAENAARLTDYLQHFELNPPHLVCHSLGGLVARQYLNRENAINIGSVVMLGTPNQTSRAAATLKNWPGGQWLLGNSLHHGLLGPLPEWNEAIPLGVIAGDLRLGLGMIIPGIPEPNDGTIAVEETRLECMQDHIVVHASHFGLLLAESAWLQSRQFIEQGCFQHSD